MHFKSQLYSVQDTLLVVAKNFYLKGQSVTQRFIFNNDY